MSFALFKNEKRISRWHSTRRAAKIEAFEAGAVISWGVDFAGDTSGVSLRDGYAIMEQDE